MTAELSPWVVWPISILLVFGAALTLIGAIGPLTLRAFYERMHPPTLGGTMGGASIILASMIYFTAVEGRPVVHQILLLAFIGVTSPVTLLIVIRAALHRDRVEGKSPVPDFDALEEAPRPEER